MYLVARTSILNPGWLMLVQYDKWGSNARENKNQKALD
jgi:hypothetical protein